MSKSVRIFVACAVGAFVGSLIALQMYHMFWWVGAAIGAFTAYLGYNVEEVIAAIPVAYRRTINWRPDREWWRAYYSQIQDTFNMGANIALTMGVALIVGALYEHASRETLVFTVEVTGIGSVGFGLFMALFLGAMGLSGKTTEELQGLMKMAPDNPVKFLFLMVPRVALGVWWLIRNAPKGLMIALAVAFVVKDFTTTFFRLIHSELRLLCAVDAALGAAVGYFTGNPLIGAVAGGLLGVANYEIITVRVMKLAGARSMFK